MKPFKILFLIHINKRSSKKLKMTNVGACDGILILKVLEQFLNTLKALHKFDLKGH